MLQRNIARVVTVPPLAPGFIGPGHLAAQVVSPEDFALNDPFILLMDDHLDIGDGPLGGAHPHAGFETVTLLLTARSTMGMKAEPSMRARCNG